MSIVPILEILEKLLSPEGGCPWDQKQTLKSISSFVLEEAFELIDAIDENNTQEIMEETGDVLFTLIFLIKLGEKQNLFDLKKIVDHVVKKMIGRHPHVFNEEKNLTIKEIEANWKRIKKTEKKSPSKIPNSFPLLMRAKKIFKQEVDLLEKISEEEWLCQMFQLLKKGAFANIDMERVLRKALIQEESKRSL